ncbi:MAG TPA: hypothetical protein VK897_24905 [Anaerolineales bacterium]|nr:hypothetical protein [Anaerolineales bacterium]
MATSNALIIDLLNKVIAVFVTLSFLIYLATAVFSYARGRIQKDGLGKGGYLGIVAGTEAILLVTMIYFLPWLLARGLDHRVNVSTITWILLYSVLVPMWYSMTHKTSGRRGLYAILIVLTTLLLGWQYHRWIGILFISIPVLRIFYEVIDKLAQVILPASDPEDPDEKRQKTQAYLMYMLGLQYPFWAASKKAARDFDKRIDGNTSNDYGRPGLAWTWPHQVLGLSRGIEFIKACGPGTIFTGQYEAPVALVDLRRQFRTSVVEAITKDGMKVPAVVFMAFDIDDEKWPKAEWSRAFSAKMKHTLPGSLDLDHTKGSYPYSSGRVRAALSMAGLNTSPQDGEKQEFFWDEWVIRQIEHATREVLSERSLDELWCPQNDEQGVSAQDEMAMAIRSLVRPKLTEFGVNLLAARIINFNFEQDSQIARQNIKTWSTYWEQQVTEAQADAEAIYREEIEKAHAFSKSVLLDAIAEGMNAARKKREDLPRHVIAQYYVHALEEYIKKQPGLDVAAAKKRVEEMRNILLYNQAEDTE